MTTATLPASLKSRLGTWLSASMRTPLSVLLIYCLVSLYLKENYPFSHYPMYSNPGADRSYYIVANGEGKPLPIADVTGGIITCPKVGKMFRTKSEALAAKLKISTGALSAEQKQQVGSEIFRQLRQYAKEKKTESLLPPKFMLQKVDISQQNGTYAENPQTLAVE